MAKASKKGLLMQVTGQFGDQCVFRESNKQLIMSQKTIVSLFILLPG